MRHALGLLTPAVRDWVRDTFGALTPPQGAAIPAIHGGEHVLISAPTETGKTLAAFLAVLSVLVAAHEAGTLGDGIQAVHVSPPSRAGRRRTAQPGAAPRRDLRAARHRLRYRPR
jgi:Lhr-like helicase